MNALEKILDALAEDPLKGAVERKDGWYNGAGYPIERNGRPDWCAKCASLELETSKYDVTWRPARRMWERTSKGELVALSLCVEHQAKERERRDALRKERET